MDISSLNGQFNYNRDCVESRLNKGVFVSDTDCLVTKMYAKYYAMDDGMALTMDEYEKVIAPPRTHSSKNPSGIRSLSLSRTENLWMTTRGICGTVLWGLAPS